MSQLPQLLTAHTSNYRSQLERLHDQIPSTPDREPGIIEEIGKAVRGIDPDFLQEIIALMNSVRDILYVQIDNQMFAAAQEPRNPFVEYVDHMVRGTMESLEWWFYPDELDPLTSVGKPSRGT